jgi:hypothetical protein
LPFFLRQSLEDLALAKLAKRDTLGTKIAHFWKNDTKVSQKVDTYFLKRLT